VCGDVNNNRENAKETIDKGGQEKVNEKKEGEG